MRTIDEIYSSMKSDYEARCGLALREGGDMSLRLYTTAAQVFALERQAEFVSRQSFPQTAEGEYLDMHAELRGISRSEQVYARGKIRFFVESPATSAVAVEAGVVCRDSEGAEFITEEAGEIAEGALYCEVAARAILAGEGGNVPAGAITLMQLAPIGVAGCQNPNAFAGGGEGEDDATLRKRILGSYRSLPNGANKAYYETQAGAVEGVYAVEVLPKKRGLGTVDVIVAAKNGIPDSAVLTAVQERLEQQREICVDISVREPELYPVTLKIAIAAEDFAAAKAQLILALEEYFDGSLLGKGITLAQIGNVIFGSEGVSNYKILSPAADNSAAAGVLPTIGSITISEMGA